MHYFFCFPAVSIISREYAHNGTSQPPEHSRMCAQILFASRQVFPSSHLFPVSQLDAWRSANIHNFSFRFKTRFLSQHGFRPSTHLASHKHPSATNGSVIRDT